MQCTCTCMKKLYSRVGSKIFECKHIKKKVAAPYSQQDIIIIVSTTIVGRWVRIIPMHNVAPVHTTDLLEHF